MKEFTYKDRLYIREYYNNNIVFNPYFMDFIMYMTPIEQNVWHDIRINGLPFYQQFPVSKYFIDFADPIKKIGIEVDGKRYHIDKDKDKKRQEEIEKLGWTIYRIDGCATFTECDIDYDLYDRDIHDTVKDFENDYINNLPEYKRKYINFINYLKNIYKN